MPEFRHFGGLKPVCQSSVRPSNVIHHSSSRAQQRNSGGGGIVTVRVALPPGRPVRPSAVDSTTNKYDQVHQPPASLLRFREGGHRPRRQDLRSWYVVGLCDVGILIQISAQLVLVFSSSLSLYRTAVVAVLSYNCIGCSCSEYMFCGFIVACLS